MAEKEGIWLTQNQCKDAMGVSVNCFIGKYKARLKEQDNGEHRKKYFLPFSMMTPQAQIAYSPLKTTVGDPEVDAVLTDLNVDADLAGDLADIDIQEARKQKILKETEYLSQKIRDSKETMFAEWSEKFFSLFRLNFAKFKNTLIELRLTDEQLLTLSNNLESSLRNMENSLDEIKTDYVEQEEEEK